MQRTPTRRRNEPHRPLAPSAGLPVDRVGPLHEDRPSEPLLERARDGPGERAAGRALNVLAEDVGLRSRAVDPRAKQVEGRAHADLPGAGLSRAGFAPNFKKWVGVALMEYLTQWRMQVACDLLREADSRIAEVAAAVGYESESAFSVAFTRIVQQRPGHYRRGVALAVGSERTLTASHAAPTTTAARARRRR